LKETLHLLGDNKKSIPLMIVLFLATSILEVFSIGVIYPYMNIILDYDGFTSQYLSYFDFNEYSKEYVLILITLIVLSSYILKSAASIYIKRKIFVFSHKVAGDLRIKLINSFQSFSYLRYLDKNSADYVHSINNLSSDFQSNIKSILYILSEIIVVIAISVILGLSNFTLLALSFIIFGIFGIFFDLVFGKKLIRYGKEDNIHSSGLIKTILETVNNFKIIKIYNLKKFFLDKLIFHQTNFIKIRINLEIIKIIPKYIIELIVITIITLSSLYFLIFLKYETVELISILGLFGVAAIRLLPSLSLIISQYANLRKVRNSTSLLYKDTIVDNKNPKTNSLENNHEINLTNFNHLKINNLSFKYNKSENFVIQNLNLEINKGDKIGIIGESGVGKSTLIDIILGLLSPTSGKIFINNHEMDEVKKQWQEKISFIPQDLCLIDDTLIKNIALGKDDSEIEINKIQKSIEKSKLTTLVDQRVNHLEMHIGERGLKISGGQKQRIALARLFYFDKEFVILDEATSALDSETEDELINDIYGSLSNKTLIIISHKEKNLAKCNRVIRIEKNKITEERKNDNKN
jgi:ATP-binding cassette, subfamily B, bacterial PglK